MEIFDHEKQQLTAQTVPVSFDPALLLTGRKDDIILTYGVGTVGIVTKELWRRCVGIELRRRRAEGGNGALILEVQKFPPRVNSTGIFTQSLDLYFSLAATVKV